MNSSTEAMPSATETCAYRLLGPAAPGGFRSATIFQLPAASRPKMLNNTQPNQVDAKRRVGQRLRQRPAAGPHRLGPGRHADRPGADPRDRRTHRAAGHAAGRQPRRRGRRRAGSTHDLVAGVERGLLVTCLWYIREVDPQSLLLTGLTRDGVYLVEGGEITGAVNNFRFNESPIDLLDRFTAASATVPSLLPRVGRLLPPHRDAGPAGPRLQHVHGLPGPVGRPARHARRPRRRRSRLGWIGRRESRRVGTRRPPTVHGSVERGVAAGDRRGRVVGRPGEHERRAHQVADPAVRRAYDLERLAVVVAAAPTNVPSSQARTGAPPAAAEPGAPRSSRAVPREQRRRCCPSARRPSSSATAAGTVVDRLPRRRAPSARTPPACRAARPASRRQRSPVVLLASTTAPVRRTRVDEQRRLEPRHRPGVPDQHARTRRAPAAARARTPTPSAVRDGPGLRGAHLLERRPGTARRGARSMRKSA